MRQFILFETGSLNKNICSTSVNFFIGLEKKYNNIFLTPVISQIQLLTGFHIGKGGASESWGQVRISE